ncbi:uncharacterized protein DNG_08562 [Cephalotrichum gorgonifer]|uniref:Uncharacterized protein n=1 Tax=Cephalotrichum gorgonifer TaxID=2041049 RepID=A0AAE8N675_9PEZI|nr:uncharacterized protein DNG_08562 [Cephalotrichum gorgonifer]
MPPGSMPSHTHAAAPNGAGYNVVFVPTPMQGQGFPAGSQFAGHPNPNANLPGAMGLSSHPCALNPQQAVMVAPTHQSQTTTHTGQPSMMGQSQDQLQQALPRPEPRVFPQQGQPSRRLPHQEHSPGKHIIVDIADTAMEVFPFAKVAKRHNVAIDKVRNIFDAVVAVPFLRVPTDKRRAGKVGQERVKKYLMVKKDLKKQAGERGESGQVSAYDVARSMGPKAPGGRADGFPGPW